MYRSMRYFTRATLRAAVEEIHRAGLPSWHESPTWASLSRKDRFVVVINYPFLTGNGYGIPFVRCVVQWAEGGMQWTVDVSVERFRSLPKMTVGNPDLYKFQ